MDDSTMRLRLTSIVSGLLLVACGFAAPSPGRGQETDDVAPPALAPLPAAPELSPERVELGKRLFFDGRLSGDATIRCATCHAPDKAWCDGLPLSQGYPGTLYFYNTPTIANVVHAKYVYWDGRLPATDLPTVVRDHISEAHFMQADGRLVIERLRQVPQYAEAFQEAFGGEPTYGRILAAVSDFVKSVRSHDVPFDRYLEGDNTAMSEQERRGLELFRGQANCIQCHHGPMLSDGRFHNLGLPPNRDVFQTPLRHITYRRFMRTLGVSDYANLRIDVGLFAVTKQPSDRGCFRTPSLREVSRTAPYMHNGLLVTLEDVVGFYNRGGGDDPHKDPQLKPLDLNDQEQKALVAFLKTLSGAVWEITPPESPPYELRTLGEN